MRIKTILILFILIFPAVTPASSQQQDIFYLEEKSGYYRDNNQMYRFEEEREFVLEDYKFNTTPTDEKVGVSITYLQDNQYGDGLEIYQDLNKTNFRPNPTFDLNGKLISLEWDMTLFREPTEYGGTPFGSEFNDIEDRTGFDLAIEEEYFTWSLSYPEFHPLNNGSRKKILVNTEISSNNNEDGRVYKTAIHIVKKNLEGERIFEYDWSIKEVDTLYRVFNYLDQPFLLVPYIFALIFGLIFLFNWGLKYWRSNNFRIVKGNEEDQNQSSKQAKPDTSEKQDDDLDEKEKEGNKKIEDNINLEDKDN